jgi:methylmalonyl-CoA mutase
MPKFNSISISGYHMHEAGATAVQELAFTIADGKEYARRAMAAGLKLDDFAPRLSFFFGIGMNFFMEVAKLRAARTLWCAVMEGLGAQDERSKMLRTHCQTSGVSLQEQDPYNNVIRTTIEALAAVLGGTQSLHCNALDEALALPTEETAQIALRTQQIIAYESGAPDSADPFAGSYFLERLTDDLEAHALALLDEVDRIGGGLRAVETGYYARQIEESAYAYQRAVEDGEKVIVGVNRFASDAGADGPPMTLLKVDPAVRDRQAARLAELRGSRDGARVAASLARLRAGATGTENVLPLLVECARAQATLGEMAQTLRDVLGEYRP